MASTFYFKPFLWLERDRTTNDHILYVRIKLPSNLYIRAGLSAPISTSPRIYELEIATGAGHDNNREYAFDAHGGASGTIKVEVIDTTDSNKKKGKGGVNYQDADDYGE